jgi:hypothetical protein
VSRSAAVVRVELDACNAERVEVDGHITERRAYLDTLNARASALETEFQVADAAEKQAALASGNH